MAPRHKQHDRRTLLDAKLTELMLYAKELCPEAVVEASTIQYDDEDGHMRVFPPPALSEAEEECLEMALGTRAGEIFDATGLLILCAVFDTPTRS
jgi:hypothetical protein